MKASVKLRDGAQEQPLVRAKLPLTFLCGLPVSTGVTFGNELGLHLSTFFKAGPCFRVTLLPQEPQTPLCITLKAGLGPWASPSISSLIISLHLKLPTAPFQNHQQEQQRHPTLSFSIKPRRGDFSLCKNFESIQLQASPKLPEQHVVVASGDDQSTGSLSVSELAKVFEQKKSSSENIVHASSKSGSDEWVFPETGRTVALNSAPATPPPFFRGWSLVAHSRLPLGKMLAASIRWRVGIPDDLIESLVNDPQRVFKNCCLPVLKFDKVSFCVGGLAGDEEKMKNNNKVAAPAEACPWIEEDEELSKVAVMCSSIRRQVHLVYAENQMLRSTMEEMKSNFNSGKKIDDPITKLNSSPAARPNIDSSSAARPKVDSSDSSARHQKEAVSSSSTTPAGKENKVKTTGGAAGAARQEVQKKDEKTQDSLQKNKNFTSDIAKELQKAIGATKVP